MADFQATGGCFCAENRFEISKPAVDTHHCQCSICRRLQGAAFVTLSIFPKDALRWAKGGKLDTFHSSEKVHRHRCKNCGTPLTITLDALPDLIAVTRSSLDKGMEPGHPPKTLRHAFWPDRVDWVEIHDSLPKVDGFS
jgi:hypothetical protein